MGTGGPGCIKGTGILGTGTGLSNGDTRNTGGKEYSRYGVAEQGTTFTPCRN